MDWSNGNNPAYVLSKRSPLPANELSILCFWIVALNEIEDSKQNTKVLDQFPKTTKTEKPTYLLQNKRGHN